MERNGYLYSVALPLLFWRFRTFLNASFGTDNWSMNIGMTFFELLVVNESFWCLNILNDVKNNNNIPRY